MTFAELKAALSTLTPEQLAESARWVGDDRGGVIDALEFADEDTIYDNDSGELYQRSQYEAEYGDPAKGCKWPEHRVVGKKGTPLLFTKYYCEAAAAMKCAQDCNNRRR